ncbi:uncharacterized protein FFUJ_03834 [Fusarium fujikuroi IMI 58289]|uniref:Uncharacterized protein n=1 Tax=Gibberella fujikuroi (strain CBS 195.34 / IMI 58289 / NRRL A-6831) TaxID=1279085 RepID=S0DQQ8_GIBF5|nr:uncharacterized protein FFUJ_03834 [Fusarium fujikuroi IMI 58289]CCT64904.1 uncharacterized protein FFUJ_03834 [Fusarium fujikuroi IMI 58289]SCN89993.1 uncharacterized protein FFM5_04847 [Fusarium fujikuroi]SCO36254.1 uncharacterized protein FFMR_04004 [Fusarium fujikuroi]
MDHSLAVLTEMEFKNLHNVNTLLWDLSFHPTAAAETTQSSITIHFPHSSSPLQSTMSPHSWTQTAAGITESLNEPINLDGCGFASTPEGETPTSSPSKPQEQVISKGRNRKSRCVIKRYLSFGFLY